MRYIKKEAGVKRGNEEKEMGEWGGKTGEWEDEWRDWMRKIDWIWRKRDMRHDMEQNR